MLRVASASSISSAMASSHNASGVSFSDSPLGLTASPEPSGNDSGELTHASTSTSSPSIDEEVMLSPKASSLDTDNPLRITATAPTDTTLDTMADFAASLLEPSASAHTDIDQIIEQSSQVQWSPDIVAMAQHIADSSASAASGHDDSVAKMAGSAAAVLASVGEPSVDSKPAPVSSVFDIFHQTSNSGASRQSLGCDMSGQSSLQLSSSEQALEQLATATLNSINGMLAASSASTSSSSSSNAGIVLAPMLSRVANMSLVTPSGTPPKRTFDAVVHHNLAPTFLVSPSATSIQGSLLGSTGFLADLDSIPGFGCGGSGGGGGGGGGGEFGTPLSTLRAPSSSLIPQAGSDSGSEHLIKGIPLSSPPVQIRAIKRQKSNAYLQATMDGNTGIDAIGHDILSEDGAIGNSNGNAGLGIPNAGFVGDGDDGLKMRSATTTSGMPIGGFGGIPAGSIATLPAGLTGSATTARVPPLCMPPALNRNFSIGGMPLGLALTPSLTGPLPTAGMAFPPLPPIAGPPSLSLTPSQFQLQFQVNQHKPSDLRRDIVKSVGVGMTPIPGRPMCSPKDSTTIKSVLTDIAAATVASKPLLSSANFVTNAMVNASKSQLAHVGDGTDETDCQRQTKHKQAEQKRRDAMKEGFERLKRVLPENIQVSNEGRELPRPALLMRAVELIEHLLKEIDGLKKQEMTMANTSQYQSMANSMLLMSSMISNSAIPAAAADFVENASISVGDVLRSISTNGSTGSTGSIGSNGSSGPNLATFTSGNSTLANRVHVKSNENVPPQTQLSKPARSVGRPRKSSNLTQKTSSLSSSSSVMSTATSSSSSQNVLSNVGTNGVIQPQLGRPSSNTALSSIRQPLALQSHQHQHHQQQQQQQQQKPSLLSMPQRSLTAFPSISFANDDDLCKFFSPSDASLLLGGGGGGGGSGSGGSGVIDMLNDSVASYSSLDIIDNAHLPELFDLDTSNSPFPS